VLFLAGSLLTGVGASAAQNAPVTKTCSQCGAVLPSSVRACNFCDSSFSSSTSCYEDVSASPPQATLGRNSAPVTRSIGSPGDPSSIHAPDEQASAWRGEVSVRMEAYRARKRRRPSSANQSQLPFECESVPFAGAVALDEGRSPIADDFSFTIAIGRNAHTREQSHGRMEIDVSVPPASRNDSASRTENSAAPKQKDLTETYGLYPVASLEERRFAAAIDVACLLFAYGGFLALFGSLGGQFTLSKLSAAVYGLTFAIVYLQYFALFTIFGGTTPGMMFRGLQVSSFTGDPPAPRQMALRAAGYILSAGTFFLGFFWAWWDEDALTWHDRLSHTYLSVLQTHDEIHSAAIAHSHGR
jgi:uncharacterized RDD family membrane protein YckC